MLASSYLQASWLAIELGDRTPFASLGELFTAPADGPPIRMGQEGDRSWSR
jgi:hypothetical protein